MVTMKGKRVITNVYLDPEVYEALKTLSGNTGAPIAFYIRKGVDMVLAESRVKVAKPKTKRNVK